MDIRSVRASLGVGHEDSLLRNMGGVGERTGVDIETGFH